MLLTRKEITCIVEGAAIGGIVTQSEAGTIAGAILAFLIHRRLFVYRKKRANFTSIEKLFSGKSDSDNAHMTSPTGGYAPNLPPRRPSAGGSSMYDDD